MMIQVVFSDSARGNLLMADKARAGADVYAFDLAWNVGDLSEATPGAVRRDVLCALCHFSADLPGIREQIERKLQHAADGLQAVLRRSAAGEPVRVWYSGQSAELCGFCWLLARLDSLSDGHGPVYAVKLPVYIERADGVIESYNGWGEVEPGKWHEFLPLVHTVSPAAFRAAASRWRMLTQENAPLRAVVNGRLVSVPADFYDSFLRREIERLPEEWNEAELIGNVIGRYQLGVEDGWFARRVEAMMEAGELAAVTQAAQGDPVYNRILRRNPIKA